MQNLMAHIPRRIPTSIQSVFRLLPSLEGVPVIHLTVATNQPLIVFIVPAAWFHNKQLTYVVSKYTSRCGIDPEQFPHIVPLSKLEVRGFHGLSLSSGKALVDVKALVPQHCQHERPSHQSDFWPVISSGSLSENTERAAVGCVFSCVCVCV